ncbi:hypothetical protein [Burkholderia multivorans]|uniref:hypothetical protein n=1 Tax=Burkholderia multivorans TaxID=87883 RepID=UPI0013DF935F|nr:hypothetical protein [Burkholderia multivorans]MBU9617811.1 hypothetical protein [Burkholderia multivorans]NGM79754.1 hypothetical protein [Burkholderia multivorans]
MFENDTKNQHFVTQAEQRLNAANPQADDKNKRIYSFKIVDRENYGISLEKPDGNRISKNLSASDIFSFDVVGDSDKRLNFEALFQKYEGQVVTHTNNLLDKLKENNKDIKTEIIDLFSAKFLNFVRNPFSVAKIINTFHSLAAHDPTNPELLTMYRRIVDGRKPHQAHRCSELGISNAQYLEWLRILFMLLMPLEKGQPNFFDRIIRTLFEDRDNHLAVWVCEYDHESCLLPDRGYSQPLPNGPHMALSFNLRRNAFITYIFADPRTLLAGKAHPEFLDKLLADRKSFPVKSIDVRFMRNNRELLAIYNGHVVYQCHERVFCAAKDGVVLPQGGPE